MADQYDKNYYSFKVKQIHFRERQCILVVLTDMTAIQLLQEEERRAQRAAEKTQLMKLTQATVSHNMLAPVETIISITDMLTWSFSK